MERPIGFCSRFRDFDSVLVRGVDGDGCDGDRFALSRIEGECGISRATWRLATCFVGAGLRDGGILRRDDLSRIFAEAIHCVERECGSGCCCVGSGVWRLPRLSGRQTCDRDHGVWIDVWNAGAMEKEFAAGNDDACAARYGERDCGAIFEMRNLTVDS